MGTFTCLTSREQKCGKTKLKAIDYCHNRVYSTNLKIFTRCQNLIGHTTTNTGLTIQAELDKNAYPTGMKVSSEAMKRLNLSPAKFHGKDWNSAIKPHQQRA